jgi:hypothetical protein
MRWLPGVEAAAFADGLPMDADHRNGMPVAVEDRFVPGQTPPNRRVKHVSPGLFAVLGTRLLAGRDFNWEDLANRRRVAIVSESMARESWGQPRAAIGKKLGPGSQGDTWHEVVGVVEDVHDDGAHKPPPPIVYFRTGVNDATRPDQPPSIRRGLTLAIRSSRVCGSADRELHPRPPGHPRRSGPCCRKTYHASSAWRVAMPRNDWRNHAAP